jgi:hypothetical protein
MAHCQGKSFQRLDGVLILMKAQAFTHKNVDKNGTFRNGRKGQVEVDPTVFVDRDNLSATMTTGRLTDGTVHGIAMFFDSVEEMEEALK